MIVGFSLLSGVYNWVVFVVDNVVVLVSGFWVDWFIYGVKNV